MQFRIKIIFTKSIIGVVLKLVKIKKQDKKDFLFLFFRILLRYF